MIFKVSRFAGRRLGGTLASSEPPLGVAPEGAAAPRLRIREVLIAMAVATLLLASTSRAATITLGSPLTGQANTTAQQPVDTALWNLLLASSGNPLAPMTPSSGPVSAVMPADGQIVAIRVKGVALPNATPGAPSPLTQIHFQDLQPQADGSVFVAASSEPFNMPTGGNPNQVTPFTPTNLCVHKGDFLAFNDEGGFDPTFYPNGVAFQVLSDVAGSTSNRFSQHNGTGNGSRFTGIPLANQELLMQWDLASGPDAASVCPGGTKPSTFGLPPPTFAKSVDVKAISGTVLVRPPLTAAAARASAPITKGRDFVPLSQAREIPVGSQLDTTHGLVRMVTANAAGTIQTGDFGAGLFTVLQRRKQRGLAVLALSGGRSAAQVCGHAGKARASALSSSVLRLLRGNAHGRFATRGRYSAATVRGTLWTVEDRCDGTLTRVQRGTVIVRDFRRQRTIAVSEPHSYLARAPLPRARPRRRRPAA